jgi:hypothetical protein
MPRSDSSPRLADPAAAKALAWTHTARFLTTAASLEQLPPLELAEIAFVGRSNAGKSTAINALAQRRRSHHVRRQDARSTSTCLRWVRRMRPMRCSSTFPAMAMRRSSAPPNCAGRK